MIWKRLHSVPHAITLVFRHPAYWVLAVFGAAAVLAVSLVLPAWVVPSNSLAFELSLMRPENFVILGLLSALSGVLIALNVYSFKRQRRRLLAAGEGGIIASIAMIGGLVSTSCGCGVGLIVGLLGLGIGTTTFIIANQLWIQLGALLIVVFGLYYAARSITEEAVCAVPDAPALS